MSAVMSPLSVLTVRLSVKLESNTLAPPTTWYFKTTSSVGSSISDNEAKFNSVNSLLKKLHVDVVLRHCMALVESAFGLDREPSIHQNV